MSSKLSVADVLERAADLIEPEGAWTQGYYARTASGANTYTNAADAVSFCAIGAIARINGHGALASGDKPAIRALEDVSGRLPQWNDDPERTQAEVVSKLREAAARARKEASNAL